MNDSKQTFDRMICLFVFRVLNDNSNFIIFFSFFFLFLVTKYIKVGLDDPDQSNNSTNINDTFQFNNNNNTLLNNNISSSSSIDSNQNSFHYDDGKLL